MTVSRPNETLATTAPPWIVVTDFDGTLTQKDIGNELCDEILKEHWHELYRQLRDGRLNLKDYQLAVWTHFPLGEQEFISRSLSHSALRPGVVDFFEKARARAIPIYVASCGLRPYIEATLNTHLSAEAKKAIKGIRSNEAHFSKHRIEEFIPPESSPDCPYPLDKGAWATELKKQYPATTRILGIGNGTSDRSLWGHVDVLAATEGLLSWCQSSRTPHLAFEDFNDLLAKFDFC